VKRDWYSVFVFETRSFKNQVRSVTRLHCSYSAGFLGSERTKYPASNRALQEPQGAQGPSSEPAAMSVGDLQEMDGLRPGKVTTPSGKVKRHRRRSIIENCIRHPKMLITRLRFFWLNFSYYCFGMGKHGGRILYKNQDLAHRRICESGSLTSPTNVAVRDTAKHEGYRSKGVTAQARPARWPLWRVQVHAMVRPI
jgi:hypothetical protein